MSNLRISKGEVVTPEKIEQKDLYVYNGLIDDSCSKIGEYSQSIDAKDCYITAGLFDLQVNGCEGCDLWDAPTIKQFADLCIAMLKGGVTAFLPTLITADISHLQKNIQFLESIGVGSPSSLALNCLILDKLGVKDHNSEIDKNQLVILPGIHLEGPYLSEKKPGVHPPEYIRPLVLEELKKLNKPSVKLITLAPESKEGLAAINYLNQHNIIPSLGHSNATYEEAEKAFIAGIPLVTHIFNAMPAIHQRRPGAAVAALLNENVYCCVIADGLHVDPQMIRLLIKMKGVDKVILVTDIANIGTTDGSLIGSSIKLFQAVSNMVNWGIVSFQQAIQMATLNPARIMGLENKIGQIEKGKRADLVIWDKKSLKVKHVIANGINVI
jgi:N-acetylglucosamine-6-phosphate deacetylase